MNDERWSNADELEDLLKKLRNKWQDVANTSFMPEAAKAIVADLDELLGIKQLKKENNMKYRVVETANPLVSPFPDHTWPAREQAQQFADNDAPDGWAGKLTVVETAGE
jgi:hypothetical protein